MDNPGFVAVLPTLLVFALAIVSRRPIESLVAGALAGLGIIHGSGFISGLPDSVDYRAHR
ncbi:MAG: hypothetical protein U5K76_09250 [Woeseiaceae bacterium]|nr:hypothetical protein [Woeseiaceae bacterium]